MFRRNPYRSRHFVEIKWMFAVLTVIFIICEVYRWQVPSSGFVRTVTVTFDYDYGGIEYSQEVEVGLLEKPPDPEREGFVFTGWSYHHPNGDEVAWDFSTDHIVSDMTLYANWRLIPRTKKAALSDMKLVVPCLTAQPFGVFSFKRSRRAGGSLCRTRLRSADAGQARRRVG